MPTVPQILGFRRKRGKKYSNTTHQRSGFGLVLFICISLVLIVFGSLFIYMVATKDLPSYELIPLLLEPPNGILLEPTRFFDRSGKHLIHLVENPAGGDRTYFSITSETFSPNNQETLPAAIIWAAIAISDPTFLTNLGFSTMGIQENTHNTIAQRLVLDQLLWDESPSIWRSIRERILAAQITTQYGREKVMEWYLNSTNFGNLAFGVEAAAQVYFGKTAIQLDLAESAILAAVSEAPALNPLDSPQTAIERGHIVINALLGQGFISEEESTNARKSRITFRDPVPSQNTLAPAFINLVWNDLSKIIPINRIERGGFEIITTLDYDLQLQISCTNNIHLSRIRNKDLDFENKEESTCLASQLLPTLTLGDNAADLDNISSNIVILDPQTGQLLALIGDSASSIEGSRMSSHPTGSLVTPFIYLTAFTRGFSPASLVWDIPLDQAWIPAVGIEDDIQYEGPLRLRYALANDKLMPAVQMVNQIGADNVLKIARQMGLNSLSLNISDKAISGCPGCQLVLDGGEITLIEAVQAFSVFANQGVLIGQPIERLTSKNIQPLTPVSILHVKDTTDQVWMENPKIETRPVISNQLAYLMTDILSDEAARWPSLNHPNPLEIGRPAGAKMGVTRMGNDVWTVGFIPDLVVGVWMGIPDSFDEVELSPKYASSLWHAIIQYASRKYSSESWTLPPGITTIDVCDPSGMLPTLQCPTIVSEVFLAGQEPTQPDTLYKAYKVNRETGRLATVFTPPHLIEEYIYLNIPSEANAWAEVAGLESPPETYDQIYTPSMHPDVRIDYPEMLDQLKGILSIQGRASTTDFVSYRLQAGAGINPSGWFVIQEETYNKVENGLLGTWNTTDLNGLYAIQLLVLRNDQRVDTSTIQVTLDNLAPEISITYPEDRRVFASLQNANITFLANANDNIGLEKIEFYLDNDLVTTQTEPPFAYPWQSSKGTHILLIKGIDFAGNTTEKSVTFTVE
jgi:membrane carboxypeptidase/penicillin-binding protein